ncbi:Hypothetical predicted protein [Octopus vulgaris]|uniref:Uncharacterized protein n=1 Tax=Octopus vulgaris TaxID=6645 RepID=A0AA36AY51_OCTVU|nr:Hypothetical predicted protein [Octopus vulgaris]
MDGRVEDIAECSGGEIGDFEYDAGIDLGVVVAEDGCGGGIQGCSNGCSGGCEDDSDINSLCIEIVNFTVLEGHGVIKCRSMLACEDVA